MRKDLLLSMLAASVVPTAALAEVDATVLVEEAGWKITGVAGDGQVIGNDIISENGIVVLNSAAKIRLTLTGLPEGDYRLLFRQHRNATAKAISGADDDGTFSVVKVNKFTHATEGELKFKVSDSKGGATDVVVEIGAVDLTDIEGYAVQVHHLMVDLTHFEGDDFTKISQKLTIPETEGYLRVADIESDENLSDDAKELRELAQKLNDALDEMNEAVLVLNSTLKFTDPDKKEAYLNALKGDLDAKTAYYKRVKAVYDEAVKNVDHYEQIVADLQAQHDKKVGEIQALVPEIAQSVVDWLVSYVIVNGVADREVIDSVLDAVPGLREAVENIIGTSVEEFLKKAVGEMMGGALAGAIEGLDLDVTDLLVGTEALARETKEEYDALLATLPPKPNPEDYKFKRLDSKYLTDLTAWTIKYGLLDEEVRAKGLRVLAINTLNDLAQAHLKEAEDTAKKKIANAQTAVKELAAIDAGLAKRKADLEVLTGIKNAVGAQLNRAEDAKDKAATALENFENGIQPGNDDAMDAWKQYNENKEIVDYSNNNAYLEEVADLNARVKAENERYQREVQNAAALRDFNNILDKVQAELTGIKGTAEEMATFTENGYHDVNYDIDGEYVGYPLSVIAEDLVTIQNTIGKLRADAEALYYGEEGKLKDVTPSQAEEDALWDAINALGTYPAEALFEGLPLAGVVGDYTDADSGDIKVLAKKYVDALAAACHWTEMNRMPATLESDFERHMHHLQVVEDGTAAKYMDDFRAAYYPAYEKIKGLLEGEPGKADQMYDEEKTNYEVAVETFNKSLEEMQTLHDQLMDLLYGNYRAKVELDKALNPASTDENAPAAGTLVNKVADIQAAIDQIKDEDNKKLLQGKLDAIKEKIDALRNTVNDEFVDYKLWYNDNETAETDDDNWSHKDEVDALMKALIDLSTAIGDASNYDGFIAEISGMKAELMGIREKIVATVDEYKTTKINGEDVAVGFDASYLEIKKMIEDYTKRIIASLDLEDVNTASQGLTAEEKKFVQDAINAYKEKGLEDSAGKFAAELKNLSELNTAENKLRELVDTWSKEKDKYAIDPAEVPFAKWVAEADDYDKLLTVYEDAIVAVLKAHAENDGEELWKAIMAFNNADVKANINVVGEEAAVETAINDIDTDYFDVRRVEFAINTVAQKNLAQYVAKHAALVNNIDTNDYGVANIRLQDDANEWKRLIDKLEAETSQYAINYEEKVEGKDGDDVVNLYNWEKEVVAKYFELKKAIEDRLAVAKTNYNNYNELETVAYAGKQAQGEEAEVVPVTTKIANDIEAAVKVIRTSKYAADNKHYIDLLEAAKKTADDELAKICVDYTKEYNDVAKTQNEYTATGNKEELKYKLHDWKTNDGINGDETKGDMKDYLDRISNVKTTLTNTIGEILKDAAANEANHDELIWKAQDTVDNIEDAINHLKSLNQDDVVVDEENNVTVSDVIAALEQLKNKGKHDLIREDMSEKGKFGVSDVDNDVIKSFVVGENDEDFKELYGKFVTIDEEVKRLQNLVDNSYLNALKNQNDALVAELFNTKIDQLRKAFKDGVDTYMAYAYCKANVDSHNEEYHDLILALLSNDDHAKDIYAYSALIIELEDAVANKKKGTYNGDKLVVLTKGETHQDAVNVEEYFAEELAKYVAYLGNETLTTNAAGKYEYEGMVGYSTYIAQIANDFAANYLNDAVTGKYTVAKKVVADAKAAFAAQGISAEVQTEYLKDAEAMLQVIETQINSWSNVDGVNELSKHMCEILASIDKVVVDVEGAAYKHWTNNLTEVRTIIDNAKKRLDEIAAEGVNVDAEKARVAGAESVINAETALAEKAKENEVLIDEVGSLVKNIWNVVNIVVKPALDEAEKKLQAQKDNVAARAEYLKDIEDLKNAKDELIKAIAGLDLTLAQFEEIYVVGVVDLIDQFEKVIVACTDANDNAAEYDEMRDGIYEAIDNCYVAAFSKQKANLEELFHITRYAFDVVKAHNTDIYGVVTDEKKLDSWNRNIDEQENLAGEYSSEMFIGRGEAVYREQVLNELSDIECIIEDILADIIAYGKANDVKFEDAALLNYIENDEAGRAISIDQAIEKLNDFYNEVVEAYDAVVTVEEGLKDKGFYDVIDGFDYEEDLKAFNDLKDQLDAVKGAWENEGDLVVLFETRHVENIGAIEEAIAEYKAKFQKAIDLEKAHADRLDVLQKEIEAMKTAYADVKGKIATYEYVTEEDYKELYTDGIDEYIQMTEEGLEDADANKYLVEWQDDEIVEIYANYLKNSIETQISGLDNWTLALEVIRQKSAAQDLVDKINEIFVGDDFADMIGLNAQLDDINEQNDKLQPAKVGQIVEIFEEEYEITLEDIQSLSHEVVDAAKKLLADLKENEIVRGDVSLDGKVSVLDYNQLLRMILTSNNRYDQADKKKVSADVNKNERIDVADITSLVNILTGKATNNPARMHTQVGANNLELAYVAEENGVRRMAVNLNSVNNLVNAQMELVLPEGLTVVGATAADRINGLDLHTYDMEDGRYRIVIASAELQTIEAGEGALFFLDIEGSASSDITVSEALASDANAATYELGAQGASVTGINTITDAVIGGVKKVYNMGGQMIDSMRNGINIMVGNEGKGKKVIKK